MLAQVEARPHRRVSLRQIVVQAGEEVVDVSNYGAPEYLVVASLAVAYFGEVIAWWLILKKAGYNPWLCLLFLVPGLNVIAPLVFALSRWPVLRGQ